MRQPNRLLRVATAAALTAAGALAPVPTLAQSDSLGTASVQLRQLTAGENFTCGLDADGRAWCWGANFFGQLGADTSLTTCSDERLGDGRCIPFPFPVQTSERFTAIAAGAHHACAISTSGDAWCWGGNQWGQLGPAAGDDRCEIAWKELPPPPDGACSRRPVRVPSPARFTQIVALSEATCALDVDGGAWCWGGTTNETDDPVRVPVERPLASLAGSGPEDVCGLAADGAAICWSSRSFGYEEPRTPPETPGFTSVGVGPFHSCGIDPNGRAHCWGMNENGELGGGFASSGSRRSTRVAGAASFRDLALSYQRSCAIDARDALYCWGRVTETLQRNLCKHREFSYDSEGSAMSTHPRGCTNRPRRLLRGTAVRAIALGPTHRCALLRDGTTQCWGTNAWGELGDGTTLASAHPTPVMGPPAPRVLRGEPMRTVAVEILRRGGLALLVLALVVTRSRGLLAGAEGRDVRRMWALGIASVIVLWLIFRLTRPTALGGVLDPLVPQPLLVAAGLTLVWIGMRMRGRLPAALGAMHREASSSIDPDRARSARRLGVLALAAAVLGWLPLLRTFVVPSPSRGMGGDVAYGLAMIGLLGAGLMVAAGAIVGFVLATMAHRRDPDEGFASVAIGLASLTAGCVVAVLIWFRYFL